ncbi:MAG TPA: VIT1/CCC1 transporter family protein [Gemmatimonadales bacterium]
MSDLPARPPPDWLHHLEDEADAAYLYRALAAREADPERADIYRQLAGVEDRHVEIWQRLLTEHGHRVEAPQPSLRARSLAWLGRRLGTGFLLPMLLEEEGREVKGYLQMHRAAEGSAADAALVLARESKEHADRLATLTGGAAEPWHRTGAGGVLRNVVYGFNDGLTANFGLLAGMFGAQDTISTGGSALVLAGLAGMVADALSMGASGYLAAKSEREVHEHEIEMEREEIRLMPELEEQELRLIYQAKGIPEAEARSFAATVMADPVRALQAKVREELGIGEAGASPLREGWITGLATAVGAFIPVAPLLVSTEAWAVWTSFAVAMVSHFGVGGARSLFTGRSVIRSGMDMFVVGLGVALIGYLVGEWLVRVL